MANEEKTRPLYYTENGDETTADDPRRLLWCGWCTYWTDDWSKVHLTCPVCGWPGGKITAEKWFVGAQRFEAAGRPHYVEFLRQSKQQCRRPLSFMEWYEQWLKERTPEDA